MFVSGGGHADSHFCENGVYALEADTMAFSTIVGRSPSSAAQYWDASRGVFVAGMQGVGGRAPLADGTAPASHTYDSLVWIPSNIVGNRRGAILMFAHTVGIIDLDTGSYDTPYYNGDSPVDLSYKICVSDGWNVLHARANFHYRHWDLRPTTRTPTIWNSNSRGAFAGSFSSGTNIVYDNKMMVRMPQRREFVVLSGGINARCRMGQGFDSGDRTGWGRFHDAITITSSDGSHLMFNDSANWRDRSVATHFFAAGGTYDHWGNCIWVQSNVAGGGLFRLTGLDGNTWTSERVAGAEALSTSGNGTYHRCQLFVKGMARCLMRVSSTTGYPEVCRVA